MLFISTRRHLCKLALQARSAVHHLLCKLVPRTTATPRIATIMALHKSQSRDSVGDEMPLRSNLIWTGEYGRNQNDHHVTYTDDEGRLEEPEINLGPSFTDLDLPEDNFEQDVSGKSLPSTSDAAACNSSSQRGLWLHRRPLGSLGWACVLCCGSYAPVHPSTLTISCVRQS